MRIALLSLLLAGALCAQVFTFTRDQMVAYTAKNPYPRFDDGRPKVPDEIMEKCMGLSVEEIWSILPGEGYRYQYEGGFEILHPGAKLIGRAVTAQFMPVRPDVTDVSEKDKPRNVPAHQRVIDTLREGDVLVADIFGKIDGGTIVGDNLAAAVWSATKRGMVVDGAIRDKEGIHPMPIQIYFRGSHPSAIRDVMLTGYNVPVRIGQATVVPGDLVFADRTGVYFVPPHLIQKILDRAEETHIHDEWTKEKFMTGQYKSSDLYSSPRIPALKQEYDAYLEKRLGRKPAAKKQ